jgi:hypothetical protein
VAASVIGAERMGSASWISGERTTTSRAGSGSVAASSLQSSRRLLRRPSPSARGLLRQPPEFLVSSSPRAPPAGSCSLRPRHLSTKRQVYQSTCDYDYSRRFFDFSRVLTFNNAGHG